MAESVRIVKGGQIIHGDGRRLLSQLREEYESGTTVTVSGVERFSLSLARLARAIESDLDMGEVRASLYLSAPGSHAFPSHADRYHVFVLQISGSKHWNVYAPTPHLVRDSLRLKRPPAHERLGKPVRSVELRAGSVLYVPRGHFHEAWTTGAESLHISVGIYSLTAGRVLLDALTDLADTAPDFLEDVSRWDSDQRRQKISRLLDQLSEEIDVESRLQRFRADRATEMKLLPSGTLSTTSFEEVVSGKLQLSAGTRIVLVDEPDGLSVHFPGGCLEVPRAAATVLEYIAKAARPFAAHDLPTSLSRSSLDVLLGRLFRAGVVVSADHTDSAAVDGRRQQVAPQRDAHDLSA